MNILFLDTETTGLNSQEHRVVEVCAALYSAEYDRVLRAISFLVTDGTFVIGKEITDINGISNEMLSSHSITYDSLFKSLTDSFVAQCDYIVAHNAPFDKAFIEEELRRCKLPVWDKQWVDSVVDVPYSDKISSKKLVHLAAEHGFVNPFPHVALGDVLTLAKIVTQYSAKDILKRANTPTLKIIAQVDYNSRTKASSKGFKWDAESKRWIRLVKQCDLDELRKTFDFEIKILETK